MEGVEKFLKEAETYYLATPSLQKMYSADDGNQKCSTLRTQQQHFHPLHMNRK